ncbi:MAG TPA: glutathione peroxidase [Alphaproteobacteria bacterium]|jgi:glutathione peroxidase
MTSAHDFTFKSIGGGEIHLKDFAGEAVLLVNTASECGFTPQYRDLEALWRERKGKGLVVLGVPSNDFGAQEPGTDADVRAFCEKKYAITFPLAAKQKVIGAGAHPLYRWIAAELGEGAAPKWNFHKYLISPDGALAGAWPSKVGPKSPEIRKAIDEALATPRS